MSRKYTIPGYFSNCKIEGNKVIEDKLWGETLYIYKDHKLKENKVFGSTKLIFKNGGIYEPGLFGKKIYITTKYGEVKEIGLFGRIVGAVPTEWCDESKTIENNEEYNDLNTENYFDSTDDEEDLNLKEFKEELDIEEGWLGEVTNIREGVKSISVPKKYQYFCGIAPACCRRGLEKVKIHSGVSKINVHGVPSSLQLIVADDNPYFCSIDGVLFNKEKTILLFVPTMENVDTYIIPETVKKIGEYCFSGSSNLVHISIPSSVEVIENNAFQWCKKLKEIYIPKSVKEMGKNVFYSDNKVHLKSEWEEQPSSWKTDVSLLKSVEWGIK